MTQAASIEQIETAIGHRFSDPRLRDQALTHRSFGIPHNERLEFIGDGIVNCSVALLLFERFPDLSEGELSRLRANLVNQTSLAEIAQSLGLPAVLRLGEGEARSGGAQRPSILADALEALIGAVCMDAGLNVAADVTCGLMTPRVASIDVQADAKDAKTQLQEWLQARRRSLPRYTVTRTEGEAHAQTFYVLCSVEPAGPSAEGVGANRRGAEQDAAAKVLYLLTHGDS